MLKSFVKRTLTGLIAGAICLSSVLVVNATDSSSAAKKALPVENSAVTSCWLGTCGHTSVSYSYPSYSVTGSGTEYTYLGWYIEPGNSMEIAESYSYTSTISAGLEFGTEPAKASLGVSGSLTTTYEFRNIINNTQSYRQYLHGGVQYANRSNTLTKKTRTYDPAWDILGVNNYCQFSYETAYPRGKIKVAMGYSLLPSIRNDFIG